jgi:hypothetical protein
MLVNIRSIHGEIVNRGGREIGCSPTRFLDGSVKESTMPGEAFSSMNLVEIGAVASLGILLFGIYRYKASNLESAREREERLRNLEGKSMKEGKFVVTVDNVELDERSGVIYRLKRWMLRPVDGVIYVTFRLHDIGIPEEFWEMDHADAFYDTLDFPAECVNSQMTSEHTALVFRLQTADYLDLKQFLDSFTNLFKVMEESGAASVVDSRTGFPFK